MSKILRHDLWYWNDFYSGMIFIPAQSEVRLYSKRVMATSASAILAKTVLKVGWYLKLLTSSPRSQYPVSRVASIFPRQSGKSSFLFPTYLGRSKETLFAGYDPNHKVLNAQQLWQKNGKQITNGRSSTVPFTKSTTKYRDKEKKN